MRFRVFAPVLMALAFLAGCTTHVNLIQQRRSLDQWDETADQKQAVYDETRALYTQILKATRADSSAPYPSMGVKLKSMRKEIARMRETHGEIEKYKKTFSGYAHRQKSVTSKDGPAWDEYQRIRRDYTALSGGMASHVRGFNSQRNAFYALMKKYGIARTTRDALRAELLKMTGEFDQGVDAMVKTTDENATALKFAGKVGADPALVTEKRKVVEKMQALVQPLILAQKTLSISRKAALTGLRGNQEVWTGPGMSNRFDFMKDFRDAHSQYLKTEKAFNKLAVEFDTVKAPTPTPEPAPSATPSGEAAEGAATTP